MNKTSRQSGGIPWKQIPSDLEETLNILNDVGVLLKKPNLPKAEEYRDFTDENSEIAFYDFESLETILRLCSTELALNILYENKFFREMDRNILIEILKDPSKEIFLQSYGEGGGNSYEISLTRYEILRDMHELLTKSIKAYQDKKDEIKAHFKDGSKQNENYVLLTSRRMIKAKYFSLQYKRNGRTEIVFHSLVEQIESIEIDRVLICPKCKKFFWAGRKNMTACSQCSASLRKKRWRDKVSDKDRLLYNEARRRKRNKKAEAVAQTEIKSDSDDNGFERLMRQALEEVLNDDLVQ